MPMRTWLAFLPPLLDPIKHWLEEERPYFHFLQDPGNVLSLWPQWPKLHQVFWPLCLKRVTVLNIIEIRFHSFCQGIHCFLHVAEASMLLDDLECWTMRLASLSCYSMPKALFSSRKAASTPLPFPAPEPQNRT
jgi:hypothetical protein